MTAHGIIQQLCLYSSRNFDITVEHEVPLWPTRGCTTEYENVQHLSLTGKKIQIFWYESPQPRVGNSEPLVGQIIIIIILTKIMINNID